jgi:ABC-2 type transport system ATP-binding protein
MQIRCTQSEELGNFLKEQEMDYNFTEDQFTIQTNKTKKAIELLAHFKEKITDFEYNKGTLNEVFLAVTGKGIRE